MSGARIEVIVTRGEASLGRFELEPGEYLIGRDGVCHINLDLEEIAHTHARLVLTEDTVKIEDLGSAAGTRVGGKIVTGPTELDVPSRVELGSTILRILPVEDERAPTKPSSEPEDLSDGRLEESLRGRRYEIGYTICHGSMGAIHGARDLNLGRTVAMKVMLGDQAANRQSLARFVREARVMGQLDHPNIAPVHELAVDEDNRVFYTMKYVRGVTLKDVLEGIATGSARFVRGYRLSKLIYIFKKVCDAISFAHSKGMIHRDLKPENIMIGEYGEVFVMDWGLAKLLDEPERDFPRGAPDRETDETSLTGTSAGDILGTPLYMAPEQAAGHNEQLDERTDLFALGGILVSIITLRAPVTASRVDELLRKIEMGFIVPPAYFNRTWQARAHSMLPRWLQFQRGGVDHGAQARVTLAHCPGGVIPEALSDVAMKALARKPEDRHLNVTELQEEVAAYQAGVAGALKRHRWLVGSLLFVIAALTGFLLNAWIT